ncbi:RNA polymerase sigma factor SigM [Catenuloplanes atrovinosus]|uniref:RNA polymerase sigma-70 factor (ECF subfamily) n=1 Tax=Catenuloplanes atrovinosus TaxID=137266 RepID=A0AAE3YX60_9ACTN|nr:RNA polymerase sigma factor SigM [Catenuloplanes atrovinosus]MDR7280038.1 RNA polymerase sigma-70 factor (ECF subfamily) [Catenuloplanes atrovinosus]
MRSPSRGPDTPDDELLAAHVDGDPDAFAELIGRHRDRLWAVAVRTIGDREEAADALQEALLSAHRAAARFRGDSAVTTWLHRIVVNACLDRIRRLQNHRTVPLSIPSDDDRPEREPAAPVIDHDTALVVRQAIDELPIEQRAALILVDVQGYSVAEAAAVLGVAEGTVKSRCARGRAKLAITLGHLRPGRSRRDNAPVTEKSSDPAHAGNPADAGNVSSEGAPSPGRNALRVKAEEQ